MNLSFREVIARRPYGSASDIWALGCLTITILTGRPPFQVIPSVFENTVISHCTCSQGETVDTTLARASVAKYVLPQGLSHEVQDLVGNLLHVV